MSINLKKKLVIFSILALLLIGIGSTVAYVSTKTESKKNVFTASKVASEVVESFDGSTKKNVRIKNTGDTKAYIRCAIIINFVDAQGNVYGQTPSSSDYEMVLNNENWIKGNDGFYYYVNPLNPGETTTNLIDSITSVSTPSGCQLSVEIVASAIQSSPTKVIKTNWNLEAAGVVLNFSTGD